MTTPVQSVLYQGREILFCEPDQPQNKPPLLFVHGAFAGAWMWAGHVLQGFAEQGYRAVAISLRGHGQSEGHDRLPWLSIEDYVDDLAAAVEWLGATPVLIGHSMGGFVAQKFLERHPARGLALLCSVPPQGLLASQFYLMLKKPGLFIQLNQVLEGRINDHRLVREALFAGEVSDAVVAEFLSHTQSESSRALWDMSLFNLMGLGVRQLPPVIVVGAEEDVLIPPFLVRATARTFGVEPHLYAGMGHAITHEKAWPDVSARLLAWLADITP